MTPQELRARCGKFADAILEFTIPLLGRLDVGDMANQLKRAGTAVDANYKSAQNGRSNAEFISRLGIAYDEADESYGWLTKLHNSRRVPNDKHFQWLWSEAEQLTKILGAAYRTARRNRDERQRKKNLAKQPGARARPDSPIAR